MRNSTAPVPNDDQPLAHDPLDGTTDLGALVEGDWPDDAPLGPPIPEPSKAASDLLAPQEPDDDGGVDFDVVTTQEAPMPDLRSDPVVLPWRCSVMVDGAPTPAVADPMAATTVVSEPDGQGVRSVRLRVGGVVVEVRAQVQDGPLGVRLGRDVLAGRFWIAV